MGVEPGEDDQWSWWQQPDGPPRAHQSPPAGRMSPLANQTYSAPIQNQAASVQGASLEPGPLEAGAATEESPPTGDDRLRKGLLAVIAVLIVALAAASYVRFAPDRTVENIAGADDVAAQTSLTNPVTTLPSTTNSLATTTPTTTPTTAAPSTTTAPATKAPTTGPPVGDGSPSQPANVVVVSTGPTSAEIRWESDECVGSLYQVGDFEPGTGGYPEVNRCWFNHVVLAGDESFSPPLIPNTEYVVRIQAVNQAGDASDPVEISFRTTSG